MYGLPRGVQSIREAVVMLGIRKITELATILALAANDHKPRQLVALALTRGRMCSTIASQTGQSDPESYFTVGLLSVLDAVLDQPMREIVSGVALAEDVKEALASRTGPKGELLDAAIALEQGAWDRLIRSEFGPEMLSGAYVDALEWSEQLLSGI
jgi:EAL and modified HD-GYP domain-containing signal transduction protein